MKCFPPDFAYTKCLNSRSLVKLSARLTTIPLALWLYLSSTILTPLQHRNPVIPNFLDFSLDIEQATRGLHLLQPVTKIV